MEIQIKSAEDNYAKEIKNVKDENKLKLSNLLQCFEVQIFQKKDQAIEYKGISQLENFAKNLEELEVSIN